MEGPIDDACSVLDSSPLQIFVKAKKKINDIFVEIEDYARETVTCMQSVQHYGSIVRSNDAVQVEGYNAKVRAIQNVLTRNHMKVAFFGRTSNGKSSVINAMLHEKILPTAFGHTTNCFLQVERSDIGESYLVTEGSTERQDVNSVEELAHALCNARLGESQLVHIYWPNDKCLHLRHDVVFVDSPGVDVESNFDEWIDRHCLDADVFVFVANAESTLTRAEKNFFHKVSTRLAKPNIFILNNRWDVVFSEPDSINQLRAQHMERAVEFLVEGLEVCTREEANQRIFFVSAKEALQARLQEQRGLPADSGALADGFSGRYLEFQDFERKFEECISKSAVRTKFKQHSQRGKLIVPEIRQIMDSTYDQAQQLKTQKAVAKKEIYDKLNIIKQQLLPLKQEMEEKIRQMVEDVKQRVSEALSEEIGRLAVLVDEFNLPFNPEQHDLNVYKKQLNHHVENGLGSSNLHAKLSTALAMDFEKIQREMTERMSGLLPAETKPLPQGEPFEILFLLNLDNLCDDFHVNMEFRSSEVLSNICLATENAYHLAHEIKSRQGNNNGSELLNAMVVGTGVAAVTGRLVAAFEPMWATVGQEHEFKRQYVAHATKKLQLIFNLTSANCSNQVQQELSSTFARLCHLVNEATNDMNAEIETLDKEIKQLEEAANSAKVLRNRAIDITQQLEIFEDTFLNLHN